MHTRQSGAAHVPIMFFLILMVMFLGALGFAYVTLTKNSDLTKQRDQAVVDADTLRKRTLMFEHYVEDIGNVLQKPGKYEGNPRFVATKSYGDVTALTVPGIVNPEELKKVLDDALGEAGVGAARGIENVLGALVTKVSQSATRVKDIEAERDRVMTEKAEVDSKFQKATAEHGTKAREWNTSLDQVRSEFSTAKQDRDNTIATLNNTVRQKADELTTVREAAATREKELSGEIRKHQMQNSALVARDSLRNPIDTADGKIISSQTGVPTAFINLGRKDLLMPGTVFRVRNPNSSEVKAVATVTRVDEERAEVELSEIKDRVGDYVRPGDQLFNELYTPRVPRTIYLMGRFGAPYTKPEVATILRRLGNKVVDRMGPGVDTVILGDDPLNEAADGFAKVEESEEYKQALELRVEFASLRKVRDLIRL